MLNRLRLRLTLLAAGLTGALLLAMALVALSIAEGQLRLSGEERFQSNISAIVTKLQTDRMVSITWLSQTEVADHLIISISDAGKPLQFSGAWTPDTPRDILLDRARQTGISLGVNAGTPPISVIETTSAHFTVQGDSNDRYMAAVVLIPAHNSWLSLILLRDYADISLQIIWLRCAFAALVVLGVAVLFLLCWLLAGRAIRPIAESQRKQAEFIAAASHELRSPLAVIRTSVSALGLSSVDSSRLHTAIEQECERMARLVEDLLALARSDAGSWSIRWDAVDLDTLLLETADGFYPVMREKRQSLALEAPDDPLPVIRGDAQRLRQILTVLLDNAHSYTPEGGRITLSASANSQWVSLRVSDTGPGLAPGDAERVFDRFYRADTARGDKAHFGLGLSIARELALLHHGRLSVAESGPVGATFELLLPRQENTAARH